MSHTCPINSFRSSRTDSLREGRKTVEIKNEKILASGKPSIAELRREMSLQRDREIGEIGPGADVDFRPPSGVAARDPYLEIKERRLADERRYHQLPADQDFYKRRKHWGDDDDARPPPNGPGRPPIGPAPGPPFAAQRWEDDEVHLMQWAKGRAYSQMAQNGNRDNLKTPPSHLSPGKQEVSKGTRSISAPVLMGMAAIGVKESDVEKRNKQKQYAEELKAQIRSKTLARQREKGVPLEVSGDENIQTRARPQRSDTSPPPPLRENRESQRKAEGRMAQEPPHRRWSPHEDHPEYRHRPYSPPDPYNLPGPHHTRPGDHQYPGPSYHYPTAPLDPHYPYPPQYPPYMYRPEYGAFAPPQWPSPFYPPALHPPHTYGPNPYYPPSFPQDSYVPPHRQQSENEGGQVQDSQRGEGERDGRQGNGRQQPGVPAANGKDPKKDKSAYRLQLKQQMEEKKEKEEHRKTKAVDEVQEYNPWGKGGGGAPMRDERGRLVADLRKMRLVNNEKLLKSSLTSPRGENTAPSDKPLPNTEASPNKENGPVVATLVLEENNQQEGLEDYRESLRKQMEEREAIKKKEKEAKKLEDIKELERIKSEQDRIAENYKREQEMARKREVDARARNALLKKEAEGKRAMETSKKQEEASGARAHQNLDQMSALDSSIGGGQQYRASSPPVPALKHLLHQQKGFSQLPPSPPSQVPPQPQPYQAAPSPPSLQQVPPRPQPYQTAPPVQRAPSPPVPALRKKLQADHNQTTQNQQGVPSLVENAVPKPHQSPPLPEFNPTPNLPNFNQQIPSEPQAPKQQDSAKLLRELSAIKKHLQSEHAKLAAKMLPIHRTEGTGSQTSGPSNPPSLMNRFGEVNQNGLTQQPSYLPSTQQPFYLPSTQQPSYLPSTQQPSYLPSTQQPSYLPSTQQPSYLPSTQQPSYLPSQHTIPNSLPQTSGSRLAAAAAATVNTRTLAQDLQGTSQEPRGPLLTSESEQFPIVEQVNSTNPPAKPRSRRQWETLEPRQPSALSSASVMTFDLDAIAAQNEERQRRLEAILNAGPPGDQYAAAPRDPQTVLQDFLNRTDRLQANQKLRSRANNVQ